MERKRFAETSEKEINDVMKQATPVNTINKSKWAIKIFKSWLGEWKYRLDETLKVLKNLEDFTLSDLDYCLKFFYADLRKVNGDASPPLAQKKFVRAFNYL